MMHRPRILAATLIAVALLGVAGPAMACPVCFGAAEGPMADGVNNGIFLLLGVIGTVQVGFVALFVGWRRRGKNFREHKDSFEVINGGMR